MREEQCGASARKISPNSLTDAKGTLWAIFIPQGETVPHWDEIVIDKGDTNQHSLVQSADILLTNRSIIRVCQKDVAGPMFFAEKATVSTEEQVGAW